MAYSGEDTWSPPQAEESFPLSPSRRERQRNLRGESTEYNPHGVHNYGVYSAQATLASPESNLLGSPPPTVPRRPLALHWGDRHEVETGSSRGAPGMRSRLGIFASEREPYTIIHSFDSGYNSNQPHPDYYGAFPEISVQHADRPYNSETPSLQYSVDRLPLPGGTSIGDSNSAFNGSSVPIFAQENAQAQQYAIAPRHGTNDNPYLSEADSFLNRAVKKIRLKRALHWMQPNFFHTRAWYSWSSPHSYQLPGYYYSQPAASPNRKYQHLDVFRRYYEGIEDDRFINPIDGRVERLLVQSTQQVYDQENDTTWRRTYIENNSPYIIRLAYWPLSYLAGGGEASIQKPRQYSGRKDQLLGWTTDERGQAALRWLPACIGILIMMIYPTDIGGQVRNHGRYDPFPYRFWRYPKSARNFHENSGTNMKHTAGVLQNTRIAKRLLRPTALCFLDERTNDNRHGLIEVEQWLRIHGNDEELPYIFVSYTAENQFKRRCRAAQQENKDLGKSRCLCNTCQIAAIDEEALHKIARLAATRNNVNAYWIDHCCMAADANGLKEDIYRISDVVRGAQKIVVVVGRTGMDKLDPSITTINLLREWGNRMWTWPEVLLGPIDQTISVYTRGTDLDHPLQLSRGDFPVQVWDDGDVARQLVDNYDNKLSLSRLELVVLALRSLKRRIDTGTTKFLDGDLSYALMGLLRQRPNVDPTDSAFQAFGRLSLANDSDRLLERMICLLPPVQDEVAYGATHSEVIDDHGSEHPDRRHWWANFDDFWGAQLWDIEPYIQIAGIANDDTVIIDGAFAATIHWDAFQRIAITTRESWSRMQARLLVRLAPGWLFFGFLLVGLGTSNPPLEAFGALVLIVALVIILLSPNLLLHIYGGKAYNTQPWFIGFEGYMNIQDVERKIFGFPHNRLAWTPYGSPLSHHRKNNEYLEDECEGTDPLLAEKVESSSRRTGSSRMRLFTLVDTNTMTVTMFEAERPPVVALLCGSEGGMQRAALCSYDWTQQVLYRETVLRMETKVLEKISRVGRVRFGLRRWPKPQKPSRLTPPT